MPRSRLFVTMRFAAVLILASVVGCAPTPVNPPDNDDNGLVINVIPDDGPGSLVSRDDDTLHLQAGGDPPQPDDIIVGIGDGGFLLRADSVTLEPDGSVTVATSPATIAEAVEDGTFTFTKGPPTAETTPPTKESEVFQFNQDLTAEVYNQGGITLQTSGEFELDANIDLEITIEDHSLTYFETAIYGTTYLDLAADVRATTAATFGTEGDGVPLLQEPLRKSAWGVIGSVPVVIEISANLYAGLTGEAKAVADFSTGFTTDSQVRFGAKYEVEGGPGQWSGIRNQSFAFEPTDPIWCLEGELGAQVFIKPVIEIRLYTVLVPKLDIEPYLSFTADGDTCDRPGQEPTGTFEWELAAGVGGHAKVQPDVLDELVPESPDLVLFDLEWPLANSEGTVTPSTNQPPVVHAGDDQTVIWPANTARLAATASDSDGPEPVTIEWTMVSGTGPVDFDQDDVLDPVVTFGVEGTYVLQVTASDGQDSASDTVTVFVQSALNEPPTVEAGDDQAITWPENEVTLNGSAVDNDGLPLPPTLTTNWSVDPPDDPQNPMVVFDDSSDPATTASFNQPGVYVLVLTAFDGDLSGEDRLVVTVEPGTTPPPGETLTLDLDDDVSMELVRIPAGSFTMGTESTDYPYLMYSRPVHGVTISQDIYVGRYEVTQDQWQAVMGTTPWTGESNVLEQGDCPAVFVSWNDAVEFCETLSSSSGYTIRLPSEAEWEYSCRAGTTTEYYYGDDLPRLSAYAWWDGNACAVGDCYAHAVGQKIPNNWGLYDMHGNVFEWCEDVWHDDYSRAPDDGSAWTAGGDASYRVVRGGSWSLSGDFLRSAYRVQHGPDTRYGSFGFRVVLEP